MKLDFSDKVSRTLYGVEWEEEAGEVFAFISEGSGATETDADLADGDETLGDHKEPD